MGGHLGFSGARDKGFSGRELLRPVEEVEVDEEEGLRGGTGHAGPQNREAARLPMESLQ